MVTVMLLGLSWNLTGGVGELHGLKREEIKNKYYSVFSRTRECRSLSTIIPELNKYEDSSFKQLGLYRSRGTWVVFIRTHNGKQFKRSPIKMFSNRK